MERALPLVASFFSSCTGGHRPPSMPAADRPPPTPQGQSPYRHLRCTLASLPGTAVPGDRRSAGTVLPWTRHHSAIASSISPVKPRGSALWCVLMERRDRSHCWLQLHPSPSAQACQETQRQRRGLPPPCASPLAYPLGPCRQERTRSRAARDADKVHRTSTAGCQALLRQACYGYVSSWGCRDRRQTTDTIAGTPRCSHRRGQERGVWLTTQRGYRLSGSGAMSLRRGARVPEAPARSQPSLLLLTGATAHVVVPFT